MDLYHQYGPIFTELYDRLSEGKSLIYSWNSGMGSSFLGNLYNYLSSPLTFIFIWFGHKNTFEAIAALIASKAVLSSMSMTYYLKKSKGFYSPVSVAFALMYAFSAYFVAYYWNVMWIDSMYILPFVILGIERIIDKGKISTYIIALTYAIFANYYMGYIICIFSVIYFIYYFIIRIDDLNRQKKILDNKGVINKIRNSFFLNAGIRFALASLYVGLILSFMLLPLIFILKSSSATSGSFPADHKFYFNIFDFISNHLSSLEPTIRSSGDCVLPNVYCGIFTVILLPLYLFNKDIKFKEKIASVFLLIFMFFSFNLNYLNFIWHGFHFPNDLPYRQSFIYSFMLICLAVKAFLNLRTIKTKEILISASALAAFIVLVQKIGSGNVTDTTIYISLAFTVLITIVLYLLKSKKNQAFALSIMLLCSVSAEIIAGNTSHYVANQNKNSYVYDYDDFKAIQTEIKENDDSLFYREELSDLRARMDPSWYDYNGISIFSSMAYENMASFQKNFGLYGNNINSYTYNPQTPVYNAIMGIKYIYDKDNLISSGEYYELTASNDTYNAYLNKYSLPIAFPVAAETSGYNAENYLNPVAAQEKMIEYMTGVKNIYERIYNYDIDYANLLAVSTEAKENESFELNKIDTDFKACATVDYIADTTDNIYVYIYSRALDTVSVYSPSIDTSMDVNDGYIMDLGKNEIGDTISIELAMDEESSDAYVDFCLFTVNEDNFKNAYQKLEKGSLEYIAFSDTYIQGVYTAEENEIIYTSVPFDSAWSVYIDGKKVSNYDIIKISDALIGIKTESGKHVLYMKYKPQYYNEFVIISSVSAIILILLYIMKNRGLLIWKSVPKDLWNRMKTEATRRFIESLNQEGKEENPPDGTDVE